MTPEQQMVQEFMSVFGQQTPSKPCIPDLETRKLRAKLILEEALETINALGFRVFFDSNKNTLDTMLNMNCLNLGEWGHGDDLASIADGLADLHYVAYCGTALACGLDMEPIFKEVHRSNMSKIWNNNEDLNEDIAANLHKTGHTIECVGYIPEADADLFIVKDRDGKIIKSPSYSPANIKPLIEEQQAK